MRRRPPFRLQAMAAVLALAACADAPPPGGSDAPTPVVAATSAGPTLEAARGLGVPNAAEPLPGLLTAGQLSEAQLASLAELGYTRFVSLRLPGEQGAGWEEAFAAVRGIAFTRIPVSGAEELTRDRVEELDRILDEAGDAPTVVYCASANRVGAMLALRAAWLDGATPGEAMALGRAAGMTRLEPAVAGLVEAPTP